jgi:hypothetical protein
VESDPGRLSLVGEATSNDLGFVYSTKLLPSAAIVRATALDLSHERKMKRIQASLERHSLSIGQG